MTRWIGWGAGVLALAAALSTASSAPVSAGDKTRRVEIVRIGGGARLGVALEEIDAADVGRLGLREERGALVKDVEDGSPAAEAGIKEGDVVVRYQGEVVQSAAQLARLVRETPPGRKVTVEVSRNGALQELNATLEERKGPTHIGGDFDFELPEIPPMPPVPDAPALPAIRAWDRDDGPGLLTHGFFGLRPAKLGIRYQELGDQLAKHFKVEDGAVLVSSVEPGSPAEKAGLKAGDVIVEVNGAAVKSGGDLRDQLGRLEPGAEAQIKVSRDGRAVELKVVLGGSKRRGSTTAVT